MVHPDELIVHQYLTWSHEPFHPTIQRPAVPAKSSRHHTHGMSYLSVHFIISLQQSWEVVSWLLEGGVTVNPHLQQSTCTLPAPTCGWGYPSGDLPVPRFFAAATQLEGGEVIFVGGKIKEHSPTKTVFIASIEQWGTGIAFFSNNCTQFKTSTALGEVEHNFLTELLTVTCTEASL